MEFLGPRLSSDELSQIWAMGDKSFHVVDNLHGVLAAAAPKLAAPQLDHLLSLVHEVCYYYLFFKSISSFLNILNYILTTSVTSTCHLIRFEF